MTERRAGAPADRGGDAGASAGAGGGDRARLIKLLKQLLTMLKGMTGPEGAGGNGAGKSEGSAGSTGVSGGRPGAEDTAGCAAEGGRKPVRFGRKEPAATPSVPGKPDLPRAPQAPAVPARPEHPAMGGAPVNPGQPDKPDVPKVPDVPRPPTGGGSDPKPEPLPAGQTFSRLTPAAYADDGTTMTGQDRPNPRAISNAVAAQGNQVTEASNGASSILWNWGQFIDHDLGLTREGDMSANIAVPKGDPVFDPMGSGTQEIAFDRAAFEIGPDGKREQINDQTPLMDASMVYGVDKAQTDSLRSFEGGRMKVSDGDNLPVDDQGKLLAGDPRADEQPGLTSLHTLFVREHNRQADMIAKANPHLNDQQVFEQARETVTMQVQAITYNEFLPTLLGDHAPVPGAFDPSAEGRISAEFTNAGFRLGHTMVNDSINVRQADGSMKAVPLRDVFMQRQFTQENGIGNILSGLASQNAEAVDPMIVDSLRNALFGPPGSGGLDLASLNIQRGRDTGLPSYNDMREALGLSRIESFSDPAFQGEFGQKLASIYDSPDDVDLWVGALAERPAGNSMLGETMTRIVAGQFAATAAADPDFYTNKATPEQLAYLETLTLSDIIRANSDATVDDTAFIADDRRAYA